MESYDYIDSLSKDEKAAWYKMPHAFKLSKQPNIAE
jgi:hypothetical protein